ncbi:MAG: glycosyltransferase family 4 protein [Candidatus Sericytochromatia bacterium]|nr:glycosyltransferase family 4 protein [Candidatus Sericytochromatia bacterium]
MALDIALTVGSFDQRGGIERVTVDMAHAYARLGHRVTVYATSWDPRYAERFHFVRLHAPHRPAWLRTAFLPLSASARLARHDIIHVQGTSAWQGDLLTFHSVHAAWCEQSIQSDGALSVHGLAKRLHPFHRLTIAMEKRQVKTWQGLLHACSGEVAEELAHHYQAPSGRVFAQPWGVDTTLFRPDPEARARQRRAWGVPEDTPVLLLAANEFARKGLATILEALPAVQPHQPWLLVAGRDDPEPYRARIQALGLDARVRFLGSVAPETLYPAADAFVMPSSYEGWGLVVAEALACGVPVLASRFPASTALIQPAQNGFLLNSPRDATELAGRLNTLLTPDCLAHLRDQARASVMHLDWLRVGERLVELGQRGAQLRKAGGRMMSQP